MEGDVRCESRKHAVLVEPGVIEIKCSSRKCGASQRVVVLHRFSTEDGRLLDTVRLRNPIV